MGERRAVGSKVNSLLAVPSLSLASLTVAATVLEEESVKVTVLVVTVEAFMLSEKVMVREALLKMVVPLEATVVPLALRLETVGVAVVVVVAPPPPPQEPTPISDKNAKRLTIFAFKQYPPFPTQNYTGARGDKARIL